MEMPGEATQQETMLQVLRFVGPMVWVIKMFNSPLHKPEKESLWQTICLTVDSQLKHIGQIVFLTFQVVQEFSQQY